MPIKQLNNKIRTKLIIFEGPSGVGKTTIMENVNRRMKELQMHVQSISEFSDSPIGIMIKKNSEFGNAKPNWLEGLHGTLLFVSDKLNQFNQISEINADIVVMDRCLISQFSQGIRNIPYPQQKDLKKFIKKLNTDIYSRFNNETLVIVLIAKLSNIIYRLEHRTGRILNQKEIHDLKKEKTFYKKLKINDNWNKIEVNNDESIQMVTNQIVNKLKSAWKI